MRRQTGVGSVCWGHDTDVSGTGMCTTVFVNSTHLLLRVTGRWRSTSLRSLTREQCPVFVFSVDDFTLSKPRKSNKNVGSTGSNPWIRTGFDLVGYPTRSFCFLSIVLPLYCIKFFSFSPVFTVHEQFTNP
jgi:hypothetical protein